MDEFQENRFTRGAATANFLTSGPTDWGKNFYFVLLENDRNMCVSVCVGGGGGGGGIILGRERRFQSKNCFLLKFD